MEVYERVHAEREISILIESAILDLNLNVKVYDGETDGRKVMRKAHMAFCISCLFTCSTIILFALF